MASGLIIVVYCSIILLFYNFLIIFYTVESGIPVFEDIFDMGILELDISYVKIFL